MTTPPCPLNHPTDSTRPSYEEGSEPIRNLDWLEAAMFDAELAASVRAWLGDRQRRFCTATNLASHGAREWSMLRALLEAELRQQHWSLEEAGLLAEVHQGVIPSLGSFAVGPRPLIWQDVSDEIAAEHDDLLAEYGDQFAPHDADTDAFLERLAALRPAAAHALEDAISRWWTQRLEHSIEGWAQVGVQIMEPKPH